MWKRRLVLLVLFLLLAAWVRLIGIQSQSIWFDEGWSAYAAQQPTLIAAANADATNPPLYYILIHAAAQGFGTSEFGLRVFSLLLGMLTIPLTYQLARRAATPRAGLTAAFLATVSTPLWWASQEARMYTLLAVLILVCALAWQQIITRPTRWAWLALWLGELALLYAHNTGPVAALWLNLMSVGYWLVRRRPDWRLWLAGQVGVGLLWLPYFASRFLLLSGANSAVTSSPQVSLLLAGQVWLGFWIAPWSLAVTEPAPFSMLTRLVLTGLVLLILLIGIGTLRRRSLLLLAHTLVLTVGLVAGLIVLGNDLHGRYLVMIVPLLLAVLGVGLASLRNARLRALLLAPFVALLVLDTSAANSPQYGHDDARGMVQLYADNLTADDTVIAWSYADRYELAYYWERLGVKAKRVTLPEGADLDAVLPLLPTSGDVALNVWYTQRADYRGMMGCVLGNGTVNLPDVVFVSGMSTQIYRNPVLDVPAFQSADLTFSNSGGSPVAQVVAVGQTQAVTPDRALCLPLTIRLAQPLGADLKAALIVKNPLGWTIASADAVFATANQRTTSMAQAGETLTAYPLLRLPYGAPPGDYPVYLRIYDEAANPDGYEPPRERTVSGRDLLLTTWTTLPGADWTQSKWLPNSFPNPYDVRISNDLTLTANDTAYGTLTNGDELRVSLLWRGTGALPELTLADEAGAWSVSVAGAREHEPMTLDWRTLRVPPEAESGSAVLRVGDIDLQRYNIHSLPMLTEPPAYAQAVNAAFPGAGELVGYTLPAAPLSLKEPPRLTLVWQAGAQAPTTSYTVFAQLVSDDGRVIAQSDALPGDRPTSGWRAGEYILDEHQLHYNDGAQPGSVRLIVGLYDAATGTRVRLADGSDAVTLATGLEVR